MCYLWVIYASNLADEWYYLNSTLIIITWLDALCNLCKPAGTRRWNNAGWMLTHRLRRWLNIQPTLFQRLVPDGSDHGVLCCKTVIDITQPNEWMNGEWGFRPPLCTYRLNWDRIKCWGWLNDTALQDSKFGSKAEDATPPPPPSRRLPTILNLYDLAGKKNTSFET